MARRKRSTRSSSTPTRGVCSGRRNRARAKAHDVADVPHHGGVGAGAHELSWCDSMPRDAYSMSRAREVRSHNQIPDGQDCRTVRSDNGDGDGTYSTSQECSTRYRSEAAAVAKVARAPARAGRTSSSPLRGTRETTKTWQCDIDEARWLRVPHGAVRTIRVRVITGGAVCSTLKP